MIRKPVKPEKMMTVENHSTFYNWPQSNKIIALDTLLAWHNDTVPQGATDVYFKVEESWEYDDCIVSLELHWKQVVPNPSYDKDMKKYEKKLAKWEKECSQK